MRVVDHRLDGAAIQHLDTPNRGANLVPSYLVIHYTAGRSGQSSVNHFMSSSAKASAHLVIDRDGTVWQLVPFNRVAWHAGESNWNGLSGLNRYSIGIELDNAGRLQKVGDRYQAWFGAFYDESEVLQARHKFSSELGYWHAYTETQLDSLMTVLEALFGFYTFQDILGHDDIAPQRKVDPGPAFPMQSLRSRFFGRQEDFGMRYRVTAPLLNIRAGPGAEHPTVAPPLVAGTLLRILEMGAFWSNVLLLDNTQRLGWVRNTFIAPVP